MRVGGPSGCGIYGRGQPPSDATHANTCGQEVCRERVLVKRLPSRHIRLKWHIREVRAVRGVEVEVDRPSTPLATVYFDGGPRFLERTGIVAQSLRFRIAKAQH